MPSLNQLRALLPYAAKLLPLVTGVGAPHASGAPPSLDRHLGDIQTESRSLRTEMAGQSTQLTQLAAQLHSQYERLAAAQQQAAAEQAATAEALRRNAALLRTLSVVTLVLLLAIAVMCGMLLARHS